MKNIEKLTDNRFLNIKQIVYPEMNVHGYQFAERRGVDSIAFICFDPKGRTFLVNKEYKPPVDVFIDGAFGGSIDKDKKHIEIVIDEVEEEAGYKVSETDVVFVGKSFVSTQMNQYCYLYLVLVDSAKVGKRKPENKIEEMAQTVWKTESEIVKGDDWKAVTIIAKAREIGVIQ